MLCPTLQDGVIGSQTWVGDGGPIEYSTTFQYKKSDLQNHKN